MMKMMLAAAAAAALVAACDFGEEGDDVAEAVCKNKSVVACEQDPRCTWKLPDPDEPEAAAKCKPRN